MRKLCFIGTLKTLGVVTREIYLKILFTLALALLKLKGKQNHMFQKVHFGHKRELGHI